MISILSDLSAILIGAAIAALLYVFVQSRRPRAAAGVEPRITQRQQACLLFRKDTLVDANDALWTRLRKEKSGDISWQDVRRILFPSAGLPPALPENDDVFQTESGVSFEFSTSDAVTRVGLFASDDLFIDCLDHGAAVARAPSMLSAAQHAPELMWAEDAQGAVSWCNDAFERLAEDWGSPEQLAREFAKNTSDLAAGGKTRVSLATQDSQPDRWFELSRHGSAPLVFCYATAIDAVVRAEEAQRNFVQTLTKTFAHLSTGLAIFDRDRRLALFNPALIDLSGLSADFLSGRPNLFLFFDKLRENCIMPEPKNYGDWRERMAKLVAAASDDRFHETWNLSTGLTYKVAGRPHPDGAIAFLFDDISAEISLTRRFRAEIEITQSVLDSLECSVAVFNQLGELTLCNAAYRSYWKVDPESGLDSYTILDATQQWKAAFRPNPIWQELREFVTNLSERAFWDNELTALDGSQVLCRIDPICQGATMIRFETVSPAPKPAPLLPAPA